MSSGDAVEDFLIAGFVGADWGGVFGLDVAWRNGVDLNVLGAHFGSKGLG